MASTSRVRFEIRLPILYNDRTKIEPEKYYETNTEIFEKFGGFAVMTETQGGWQSPESGQPYFESMSGFYVDTDKDKLKENIEFFKDYKKKLKTRFQQEAIYIIGYELYVI